MNKFYVIGNSVSQSYSPQLFKLIFHSLDILDSDYSFKNILNNQLDEYLNYNIFKGINVTNPFKEKIISYLDFKDETVNQSGSCNCIVNDKDKLIGYNTDCYGFEKLLKINNLYNSNIKFLIYGTGGVVHSLLWVLIKLGCQEVSIVYRNEKKIKFLVNQFNKILINRINFKNLNAVDINQHEVLINATSILNSNIYRDNFMIQYALDNNIAIDLQYNPQTTPFLKLFSQKVKIINGLDMLIFQAFKSLDIWFDKPLSTKLNYNDIKGQLIKDNV